MSDRIWRQVLPHINLRYSMASMLRQGWIEQVEPVGILTVAKSGSGSWTGTTKDGRGFSELPPGEYDIVPK